MSNPVLNSRAFDAPVATAAPMTISGAIGKSAFLLLLCAGSAALSWGQNPGLVMIGVVVGFILALIICFKPTTAPVLAPVYALVEGVVIGTVSSLFEGQAKGIVIQAIALTGGVFCAMLGAYQMRLIRPTRRFAAIVIGATMGIALFYVGSFVLGAFGIPTPLLRGSGPYAILISFAICVVAALNLILDFGIIEEGANARAPKYMEWYAGFGLLVTLVWLYLEILRLLLKLSRR
ncbi:Bax inhibitor-1/YccA family protein [Verrucomicrobiota bacterium sgz303538]